MWEVRCGWFWNYSAVLESTGDAYDLWRCLWWKKWRGNPKVINNRDHGRRSFSTGSLPSSSALCTSKAWLALPFQNSSRNCCIPSKVEQYWWSVAEESTTSPYHDQKCQILMMTPLFSTKHWHHMSSQRSITPVAGSLSPACRVQGGTVYAHHGGQQQHGWLVWIEFHVVL